MMRAVARCVVSAFVGCVRREARAEPREGGREKGDPVLEVGAAETGQSLCASLDKGRATHGVQRSRGRRIRRLLARACASE